MHLGKHLGVLTAKILIAIITGAAVFAILSSAIPHTLSK